MTAILFLSILVFNFYGYRLVLSCLQKNTEAIIEKRVDKNAYSDEELISVKTALHLPYYISSSEYERAYGSITINGKDYEYVKRRIYNDTLEVLCLPNGDKTAMKTVGNNIAKAGTDGQASAPTKKSDTSLKISLPDFYPTQKISTLSIVSENSVDFFLFNTHLLPANYTSRLERPPRSICTIS